MQKFKIIGKTILGEKYVSACCPPRNDNMWGEGGVPPQFLLCKISFFCYLERHTKIQIIDKPLLGEKYVEGKKKEEE